MEETVGAKLYLKLGLNWNSLNHFQGKMSLSKLAAYSVVSFQHYEWACPVFSITSQCYIWSDDIIDTHKTAMGNLQPMGWMRPTRLFPAGPTHLSLTRHHKKEQLKCWEAQNNNWKHTLSHALLVVPLQPWIAPSAVYVWHRIQALLLWERIGFTWHYVRWLTGGEPLPSCQMLPVECWPHFDPAC